MPDEAVNKSKMEFPGTYNRFGKVSESDVPHVERHDEDSPAEDSDADSSPAQQDDLRLLADAYPHLVEPG